MAEDLAAQIEHDLLAGPLHQVGLDEFEAEGDDERAEIEHGELSDPRDGGTIEVPCQPGELGRGGTGHVSVDRDLHQIRPHNIGSRLEEDCEGGENDLKAVGPKIGEQAAHQAAVIGLAYDFIFLRSFLRRLPGGAGGCLLIGHLYSF